MSNSEKYFVEFVIANQVLAHIQILQRLVSFNSFGKTRHIARAKSIVLHCQFFKALVLNQQTHY